jgi:hypothetical protein
MAAYYIVKQGDYVARLAAEAGFSSYDAVWDHPNNAQLKAKRKDPNILLPGDQIFIPDKEQREELRPTDQRHEFVAKRQELRLRVVLEDIFEKPVAGAPCVLTVEGQTIRLTTDGEGKIDEPIPSTAQNAVLLIQDHQTALNDFAMIIKIGNLDPVEERSGQVARLNNLGYFAGDPAKDPQDDDDAEPRFRSAVEEFQCDFGLQVDGKCGPVTQSKLKSVYGC